MECDQDSLSHHCLFRSRQHSRYVSGLDVMEDSRGMQQGGQAVRHVGYNRWRRCIETELGLYVGDENGPADVLPPPPRRSQRAANVASSSAPLVTHADGRATF